MSLRGRQLLGAYNRAVDFKILREALRIARERSGLTLDEVEERTNRNRATIHKIENVRALPNYKPTLETIEDLVLAYDMVLSAFFAAIEGAHPEPGRAPEQPVSSPVGVLASADLERFARALGEAIGKSIQEQKPTRKRRPKENRPKVGFHRRAEASDHKSHHRR